MQHLPQQQGSYPPPDKPDSTVPMIFGIISLVLGIISFLFSFIPCLGFYAFVPAIAGLGLGIAGLALAGRLQAEKGILITGIILSALATGIAMVQYKKIHRVVKDFGRELRDEKRVRERREAMDTFLRSWDSAGIKSDEDTLIQNKD